MWATYYSTLATGVFLAIAGVNATSAQCEQGWSDWYGLLAPSGACAAVFDDGSGSTIYVGGNDIPLPSGGTADIVRIVGNTWESVVNGLPSFNVVRDFMVYDDGNGTALYAAGGMGLARWDGATWTIIGTAGVNTECVAVFDDGTGFGPQIYIGGSGSPCVMKWNGSYWWPVSVSGWNGTNQFPTPVVRELVVHDLGNGPKLFAGGEFSMAGGVSANRVARWNGQAWSALGQGVGSQVLSMAAYDDGAGPALYVGGLNTHVSRWRNQQWTSLTYGPTVTAMLVHDDGSGSGPSLFVGGQFGSIGGVPAKNVAKWNGSNWSPLGDGVTMGGVEIGSAVFDLARFEDSSTCEPRLLTVGNFQSAGESAAAGLAAWDGVCWSAIGHGYGASHAVQAIATHQSANSDTVLVAVGDFISIGGIAAKNAARFDGTTWSPMGEGISGIVNAAIFWHDGCGAEPCVYLGGAFYLPGHQYDGILHWNGTAWSTLGMQIDGQVHALAVYDDGTGPALYAGGHFTVINGIPFDNIAKWDGRDWHPLGSGVSYPGQQPFQQGVRALHVYNDGSTSNGVLCVGGYFVLAGRQTANCIATWDGADWALLGGLDSTVWAITVLETDSGPQLVAGGDFTMQFGGFPVARVARWDGEHWQPFGEGLNNRVQALAVVAEGSESVLYAGGRFTNADWQPASNIARWNGIAWETMNGGVSVAPCGLGCNPVEVNAFAVVRQGDSTSLMVGGQFARAGGTAAHNLALWTTDPDIELTSAPLDQLSAPGGTVAFVSSADSVWPLQYQWRRNKTELLDDDHVSGANTPLLSITNVNAVHAGQYDIVIHGECGAVTSPPARLIVSTCCFGDIEPASGNGSVDSGDLLEVIDGWGPCPGCVADVNGDGDVNVTDLLAVIGAWGPCP